MYRIIVLICWMCTASGKSIDGQDVYFPNVYHGTSISIQSAPYQVSIIVEDERDLLLLCGGSIISPYHVLTAGHCATRKPEMYFVRAGSGKWKSGGSMHKVSKITLHEQMGFNEGGVVLNDIAIITVSPPFEIDHTRSMVQLYDSNRYIKAGENATVTGWGKLESGLLPDQLQMIQIPVLSGEDCDEAYASVGGIPDGEFCASDPKGMKDMCNGDSGGPLLINGLQAGIVSWSGPGCSLAGFPGVYTDVSYYHDWINSHIK